MKTRRVYWLISPITKARVVGYPSQRDASMHAYQFSFSGEHLKTPCLSCYRLHRFADAVLPG